MNAAVSLMDGLGLDGDRCIRVIPRHLWDILDQYSSGSSGRVREGGEKHEIYAVAFGGHLFYDLFSQGQESHGPLAPPESATAVTVNLFMYCQNFHCICSSEDQLCL